VLVTLIEAYEAKHSAIDLPDPVEAIMRLPIALSQPAVAPSANATDVLRIARQPATTAFQRALSSL